MHVLRGDAATFARIAPAGFVILWALQAATQALQTDLTITCGTEDHPVGDPHTRGEAYDVRVRGLSTDLIVRLVHFLRTALGALFTVLLETPVSFSQPELVALQSVNPHATGPHIHTQRKRGTVYPPPDGTIAA